MNKIDTSDKSYVTLERKMCLVCGKEFESGTLLLDKRLKERFDRYTTTGYKMCPEHEKLRIDGYIALVVVDASKSHACESIMKTENAHRTGEIMHIRKTVADKIFNPAITTPLAFIDQEAAEKIKAMMPKEGSK